MAFKKLKFTILNNKDMINRSREFLFENLKRRSVRSFSEKKISISIIKNIIKTASTAPSGANKQPWHFVLVKNKNLKKQIRIAAEREEKEFYKHRATEDWLKDLNKFKTNWRKPFLEKAPYLIVVFKKVYDLKGLDKKKNYYVNESVGIACGFLLMAIHNAGLVCLPHTPSPMGFLEKILKRRKNERAFLLIPVGYPLESTMIPKLNKKSFEDVCSIK
tara:strand:+ start:445 stop:1098 length:654 start_codon:yes stop_codon:yes gene_type:complete